MKFALAYTIFFSCLWPGYLPAQSAEADSAAPKFYIAYCDEKEDKGEEAPIQLDWVKKDKDIITTRLNKLPTIGSSVSAIMKLLPNFLNCRRSNCQVQAYTLNYGLQSIQHTLYGGYGTYHVDVIHFGDNVLKLRITISSDRDIINKYLLNVMQLPFDCLNKRICYEKTYLENVERYRKDSAHLFLESTDSNYRRRTAINYFTDVMTGGTFVKPYYIIHGLGSETFNHLRYFIVSKDYSALESILFSPSPTGRLFAARTLLYMKDKFQYSPGSEIYQRINEIIGSAQLISSGILSCHTAKFDYDYYNVVKDFEFFLTTR